MRWSVGPTPPSGFVGAAVDGGLEAARPKGQGPSLLRHRRLGSLAPPSGLEAARPKGQGLTPTARLRLSPPGFVGAGGPSSSEREREREREEEEERGERGGNTGGTGREK